LGLYLGMTGRRPAGSRPPRRAGHHSGRQPRQPVAGRVQHPPTRPAQPDRPAPGQILAVEGLRIVVSELEGLDRTQWSTSNQCSPCGRTVTGPARPTAERS